MVGVDGVFGGDGDVPFDDGVREDKDPNSKFQAPNTKGEEPFIKYQAPNTKGEELKIKN